ncbi:DUF445 domain-containing protein [Sporosarcina sp. G11-34]|uniref:DUF445 domain-containing protein n=1 Tax=Sporosarcina sp. G11-34 TaxID=2849605 RepID=UPI0022A8ECC5|nr:DUF445 family protein [Sporosarcina sp. G11-34]MCZ2260039.1 DUF445 family protein [Sporosarcina sp. G11-34]
MDFIWTLAFMAFIGALIGGFTNHLAIKMLFRPHEAKYIGSWRVPFTPGLIPKRRDELAVQFGRTVTNYLLTPETFKRKLLTPEVEAKAETFLQEKLDEHILRSDKTLNDWLAVAGATGVADKVELQVLGVLDDQLDRLRIKVTTGTVDEVLPEKWRAEAAERIPQITGYILSQSENYFESEEGRAMFRKLIDDFLASKGTLGSMVNMLFGESESLVSKVQREALKFIGAPGTYDLVNTIILNEWEKLQKRPVNELLSEFDWDGLFHSVRSYAKREIAIESRLDKTLFDYWPDGVNWTAVNVTPALTSFAFQQAEVQLEKSLQKLKIGDMVKEQVDSFPVSVLEDLVLGISKREFKMITVLGAVLGGVIGVVQGLIVFATNLS